MLRTRVLVADDDPLMRVAVRAIRRMLPDITFIFLATHDGRAYRRQARNVGAAGYVLKSVAREELRQVIHHALEGAC
jgi:DNA-binding NarL/FixJ family response regulator